MPIQTKAKLARSQEFRRSCSRTLQVQGFALGMGKAYFGAWPGFLIGTSVFKAAWRAA
jgi:hypothetical protein